MTLIPRPDLRCPESRCSAMVVEFREGERAQEYRCKAHGPIRPLLRPGREPPPEAPRG